MRRRSPWLQNDLRPVRPWMRLGAVCLTLALLFGGAYPAAGQAVSYQQDFESGQADGWDLEPGWQVVDESGNHVLRGDGHAFARFRQLSREATIEVFEFRYQLPEGSAHVLYRAGNQGSRYFVNLNQNSIALHKSVLKANPPEQGDRFDHAQLATSSVPPGGQEWHRLQVNGRDNQIVVYLDDQLVLDYTDADNPYLSGDVGFESLDDTVAMRVDEIVLKGRSTAASEVSGLAWVFTGGPRGGIGYDLRIDPLNSDTIWVTDAYAGTNQSIDGGLSWQGKNDGITARVGFSGDAIPIFSLTIDPTHPNILWAGTQGMRGVFKSADGGETWQETDNGIAQQANMEFRGFAVDPNDSDVVYCAGNYLADPAKNTQRGFVYKTSDGGQNWQLIAEPQALVRWILIDPRDNHVIYASTGIFDRFAVRAEGVLKSLDGGQTWQPINAGLTSLAVGALVMHPTDPQVLLAGTGKAGYFADEPGEIYGGVFKTTDGGQNWRQVLPVGGAQEETRFSALAYAPSDPNIVYADAGAMFYRSEDGGEHWQAFNVGPEAGASLGENRGQPIALVVHPEDPNLVYMNAYDGGVFISRDGGRSWRDASKGYSGAQAWYVSVDPSDPARALVASKNGIHLTRDGGGSWQGLITHGAINNMTAVAFDPASGQTFLAGKEIDGSIWRTTDGGAHWSPALGPTGEDVPNGRRAVYQIAFAATEPRTVYAASGIDTMTVDIPRDIDGPGVFKSQDGGVSWEQMNAGLAEAHFNTLALAIHPEDARVVFLGTLTGGVYKTVDGGAQWAPVNAGLGANEIRSLAIDPQDPRVIFAGAGGAGVWRSDDEGATWRQVSAGLSPEANITGLVVDPAQAGVVYAADRLSGVYGSRDGGNTWSRLNNGLAMRAVNELAISADGQHLYAATEGNGVYRMDLNGAPPQSVAEPTQPVAEATSPAGQAVPSTPAADPQTSGSATPPAHSDAKTAPPAWWMIAGGVVVVGSLGFLLGRRKR